MKGFKVLCTAMTFLLGVSMMASNAAASDVGKSWTITLDTPTRVGAALLPPGNYKVQHIKDGDTHVLVFKAAKKEIARVNCTMEQLRSKSENTSLTFDKNTAGERVLQKIAFRGDTFQHDVVAP